LGTSFGFAQRPTEVGQGRIFKGHRSEGRTVVGGAFALSTPLSKDADTHIRACERECVKIGPCKRIYFLLAAILKSDARANRALVNYLMDFLIVMCHTKRPCFCERGLFGAYLLFGFAPVVISNESHINMSCVPNKHENVKAEIARQLQAAQREADDYNGPGPVSEFRGHAHFDLVAGVRVTSPDCPVTGLLTHDTPNCPYCRLKKLKREYGLLLRMEGSPHGHKH
jgi:hypothetical protein